MKISSKLLVILIFATLVGGGYFYLRDTKGPEITVTPATGPISSKHPPTLRLSDPGSGLKTLSVTLVQEEKTIPLLSKDYPTDVFEENLELPFESSEIKNGPAQLRVVAVDQSLFPLGSGSTSEQTFSFEIDNRAPTISLLSRAHNLNRGGTGLVTYTLSEVVSRTGVQVGDRFFPGYQQPSGDYACLFAFPYDVKTKDFIPKVLAVDLAGNERQAGFYYHTNSKPFRQRDITINQQFLDAKMPPFADRFPEAGSPLEVFIRVNQTLRAQNRAFLGELSHKTSPTPLWSGAFLRQPQTATLSLFADARSYYYQGKKVDQQTHLGIDLASTAQAPLEAANHGTVVYADELGIYGQCVIIDHGLGLQTLYGHMSRINVNVGQEVQKGQIIGNSGATGLAGGDHLHFGVILSGLPVAPVEWWDGDWIKNNVTAKLEQRPQK